MDERIVLNLKIFARNLKRTNMLRSMEIEDIEQELMCGLLSRLNEFDENQGNIEHFIRKILARRAANLLESFSRIKRGPFVNFREYTDTDNSNENEIQETRLDLWHLIEPMPSKYKMLCKLLVNHSIAEVSQIIGKTRASVYHDLKRIAYFVDRRSNSKNQFFTTWRMGIDMKNLSILETSSAKEISALEIYDLMDLSDQITKLTSHAKELKEKLEDGLNLRFSEAVKNSLRSENKDTGTTRFFDGAFQVIAEVPKKVTWDQEKMEELIKRVPDERRKAIVKITYAIEERKYSELPHEYQELFREARTITPGKTKFQISIGETK
jgi:DNA-directed RNA polymerase specialized sigma24 family protein